MANYDFGKDLVNAKKTENDISTKLVDWLKDKVDISVTLLEESDHSRYDLKYDIGGVIKTFEVKEDFMCKSTGNVAVEFHSRGKDSGIAVTEADFYVYRIHQNDGVFDYIMPVKELKRIIDEEKYFRVVNGGDVGSNTHCYLFKLNEIQEISIKIED